MGNHRESGTDGRDQWIRDRGRSRAVLSSPREGHRAATAGPGRESDCGVEVHQGMARGVLVAGSRARGYAHGPDATGVQSLEEPAVVPGDGDHRQLKPNRARPPSREWASHSWRSTRACGGVDRTLRCMVGGIRRQAPV